MGQQSNKKLAHTNRKISHQFSCSLVSNFLRSQGCNIECVAFFFIAYILLFFSFIRKVFISSIWCRIWYVHSYMFVFVSHMPLRRDGCYCFRRKQMRFALLKFVLCSIYVHTQCARAPHAFSHSQDKNIDTACASSF